MSRNLLHSIYTVVVSIVLNVIVYFIGNGLGISWDTNLGIVSSGMVAFASAVGAIMGIIGYLLLGLIIKEGQRIWFIWLATIVGVLSMILPWTSASDLGTMVFLGIMHVVSVLVMTWYFGVWTPTYIAADELITRSG